LSGDNGYRAELTAKRYQRYLKEEEKKKRNSKWIQDIVAAILMLIKLITNALEKAKVKKKRVVEKVSIE
jgi:hypothetical protein